jgi:methionyl-tRNA formyltransferase
VLLRPRADDPALVDRLRAESIDLLASWFWTTKLPMRLVETARLGGIGAHPSLLPRHRGPDPTYHAILAGDVEAGVTVHRIAEGYDTGAILAQERLPIAPSWDALALARALDRPSLRLWRAVARSLASGHDVAAREQDPSEATEAPFPGEDDAWIRWSSPTAAVLRQIRALAPSPGAVTDIGGRLVTVLRASALAASPSFLEAPGEAALTRSGAVVRTADGAIRLDRFEIDGEPAGEDELSALLRSS